MYLTSLDPTARFRSKMLSASFGCCSVVVKRNCGQWLLSDQMTCRLWDADIVGLLALLKSILLHVMAEWKGSMVDARLGG